jgi:hypothetical protein
VGDGGERLFRALRRAGMSQVPERFSVALLPQRIPAAVLAGIDQFIEVFERVTTRRDWQEHVTTAAPSPAHRAGREVCFFSAWDFHLPPGRPDGWQLIEFNDNGSGFLFAALINRLFWETCDAAALEEVEPPPAFEDFAEGVAGRVEREAREFFGGRPEGLLAVVDDAGSLGDGRFRDELVLLQELLGARGWAARIAPPEALRRVDGGPLLEDREVRFVVNRSTDFLWQTPPLATLRDAWMAGHVYVAPNPFTYATRSDKGLLELLCRREDDAEHDAELGILPEERAVLAAHVPETRLLTEESVEAIAGRRQELVLKPAHGYAGRGLLPSHQVGRSRLRRLLRAGEAYVAQQRVPKAPLAPEGEPGHDLFADLRVWAYRGERFLLSGRASRRPDGIDLTPPGGWIPTYAAGPERPDQPPPGRRSPPGSPLPPPPGGRPPRNGRHAGRGRGGR